MTVSDNRDDRYLVEQIARGNQNAFQELFDKRAGDVFKLSYSLLLDHQTAEDATQDTFVKLWQKAADWKPDASAKTWLLTITRNHCLDILRKRKNDRKKHQELYKEHITTLHNVKTNHAERKIDEKNAKKIIKNTLFELPERQREAVTLVYYMDVHNYEAARIMGLKVRAFDSLLARARRTLREKLVDEQDDLKGYFYGTE